MAKLGSKNKPAIVRVNTPARVAELREVFDQYGWHYIIGMEPDQPENVTDLTRLLDEREQLEDESLARRLFMEWLPFGEVMPELADTETRSLLVTYGGLGGRLGPDRYYFEEFYCGEVGCDCRRVVFEVMSAATGTRVACIYCLLDRPEQTAQSADPAEPDAMQCFLYPFEEQSPLADDLLALFEKKLLADEAYMARLERHYHAFKAALPSLPARSRMVAPLPASSDAVAAYRRSRNQRKRDRRKRR